MPWQRTPPVTHHTMPHKYITTTITTERTAMLDNFYASYDETPPNDYAFRISVHNYTVTPVYNELVLEINVAATTLQEALQYVGQQLSIFVADDASYSVTLISETTHKSHEPAKQVGE